MKALEVHGSRLFYRQAGSGTPVVMLHSCASTGAQWRTMTEKLKSEHRVISPDLPGHGRSAALPLSGPNTLGAEAATVLDLIETLDEPVHLVGHSYGAAVAVAMAMQGSNRIRSLTLFEPSLFHLLRDGGSEDRALYREIALVDAMVSACAADDDPRAGMARFIDYWNGAGTWERLPADMRDAYTSQIGCVLGSFTALRGERWPLDAGARITCPVFAYMGLESHAVTQRVTELLAEVMPRATLTMIAGADHMLPASHAELAAPLLKRQLAAVERSEAALAMSSRGAVPKWVA